MAKKKKPKTYIVIEYMRAEDDGAIAYRFTAKEIRERYPNPLDIEDVMVVDGETLKSFGPKRWPREILKASE